MANQVTTEAQTFENLVDRSKQVIALQETLLTGFNLVAGTVLSMSVSTGSGANKLVPYDAANGNGEDIPFGILAEDTDSTSGDQEVTIYVQGVFNENKIVFYNTDQTTVTEKTDMFGRGLYYYPFA